VARQIVREGDEPAPEIRVVELWHAS